MRLAVHGCRVGRSWDVLSVYAQIQRLQVMVALHLPIIYYMSYGFIYRFSCIRCVMLTKHIFIVYVIRRKIMHGKNETEKDVVNLANESLLNYETIKVRMTSFAKITLTRLVDRLAFCRHCVESYNLF